MRIEEQVEEKISKTIIKDVVCNKCGASLAWRASSIDPNAPPDGFCGLEEATVTGQYGSPYLEDSSSYTFSLCEACLLALFKSFKHAPRIRSIYDECPF